MAYAYYVTIWSPNALINISVSKVIYLLPCKSFLFMKTSQMKMWQLWLNPRLISFTFNATFFFSHVRQYGFYCFTKTYNGSIKSLVGKLETRQKYTFDPAMMKLIWIPYVKWSQNVLLNEVTVFLIKIEKSFMYKGKCHRITILKSENIALYALQHFCLCICTV